MTSVTFTAADTAVSDVVAALDGALEHVLTCLRARGVAIDHTVERG